MGQNDTSHLDMSTVFAFFKPTVNFCFSQKDGSNGSLAARWYFCIVSGFDPLLGCWESLVPERTLMLEGKVP